MRRFAGFAAIGCAVALAAAETAAAAPTVPAFSKTFAPTTLGPGSAGSLVYVIDGSAMASPVTDLAFQDNLPSDLVVATPSRLDTTCVNASVSGAPGGSTIALSQGRLGTSSSCTVTVDVTSGVAGVYLSTSGDLTSSGGNSGTAQATLTVDSDLPGFTMALSPATIPVGALSRLMLTIDNTVSAADLASISFSATLPTGLAIASPANDFTDCSGFSPASLTALPGTRAISLSAVGFVPGFPVLTAGANCSVSLDVTPSTARTFDLATGDLNVDNGLNAGRAVGRLDVERKELQKLFIGDPTIPGETVQLQYTLTNLDRFSSVSSITFSDDLDAALTGLAASGLPLSDPCGPGSSVSGTSLVIFAAGSLGPGQSCTFSLTLTVPLGAPPGDHLSTTSPALHVRGGLAGFWDAASDRLRVVDQPLSFSKTFTTNPVGAGGIATIQFLITNESSTSTATDIAFIDELAPPFGFPVAFETFPADPCGAGSSLQAVFPPGTERHGVQLIAGTLASAASCQFDVSFAMPTDMPSGSFELSTQPITATVNGSPVTGHSATGTVVVVGAPLAFRAEFSDDPVGPLETVTLQFSLSNDSEAGDAITGLSFTDDLNSTISGLTASTLPASGFCGAGSQMAGTTTLSVSGVSLLAGESCVFSVTLSVPGSAAPGSFPHTTSDVSANVNGIAVIAPPAESELRIKGLGFSMQFIDDPVVPGAPVVLEYTIRNETTALAASSILFTHDLNTTLTGLVPGPSFPGTPCGPASSFALFPPTSNTLTLQGGALAPGATCTFSVSLDVPALAAPKAYPSATGSLSATFGSFTSFPGAADALVVSFAPNDVCTESTIVADVLSLQFGDTQDTRLATPDAGDPIPSCGTGPDGATVWYSFAATDNRTIQVGTAGSSYDTVVSIWQGSNTDCGGPLTAVACNDDLDVGVQASLAEFDSVAGTSYLIQVGARNAGSGGDLVLSVPEPSGWWLRGCALASLAWLRHRATVGPGRPRRAGMPRSGSSRSQ